MPKKRYKIYLFRHGRTTFNEKGIFTGWKDPPLTLGGRKDALVIARKLKNKKFQVAIQTRLERSKDTLKPVLKYHPECKKIITDNRMIERSYGVLAGTSHEAFIKRYGEKGYEEIHRGYNVRVPKGESFKDVEKRVKSFIKWLKMYIKKNKVNIAISAHGNSIRLFRKIWEKASKEEAVSWFIPYDKLFTYRVKI